MSDEKTMTDLPRLTVAELCERLGVQPPQAIADREITGIATLQQATESHVSFVQREKYRSEAEKSAAGLLLIPSSLDFDAPNAVKLEDVMAGVLKVIAFFHPAPEAMSFVHPTAVVPMSCEIGENVFIGEYTVLGEGVRVGSGSRIESHCVIGDHATVGENCRFFPRVTVLDRCVIGSRVMLHSGSIIGADGFRYEVLGGRLTKIPQVGRVVLEDDVEVGANTTIDRAFLADTHIGARTKIDNMVHIGHNVVIGSDCVIVAQVGIAGSVRIGRGVMIGGASSIKDHITIGDGCKIGGRSGVSSSLPPGTEVIGSPAAPIREYARYMNFLQNFSSYWKKIRPLIEEKNKDS